MEYSKMYNKYFVLLAFIGLFAVTSCHHDKTDGSDSEADTVCADTVSEDSVDQMQDELYETSQGFAHVDELFDDFIYTFARSHKLQKEREDEHMHADFSFMTGEYTTNIFARKNELELNEDTTLKEAMVERIDLQKKTINQYDFKKLEGKWRLNGQRQIGFKDSDMGDFLEFYSRFSTDTTFQQESLQESIKFTMMDPVVEDQMVEGTIDSQQWPTVCGEIPHGVISNIRYGQNYRSSKKMMLQKVSMGEGMSETFTFEKKGTEWKLTGYDN